MSTGETVEFRPREARATARNPSFLPGTDRIVFGISDVQGHQIASINRRGEDLQYLGPIVKREPVSIVWREPLVAVLDGTR
jgi:hypothetical protein